MKLRLIRIGLALLGNALGLWLAAIVLGDMEISGAAFLLAVVIFTVLTVVIQPLVEKAAENSAEALQGGSGLIATALALLITAWISDGLQIDGIGTFLLATVIVWLGTVIIGVLLGRFVLRRYEKK
jgi:uncharacterized membrane protein YvlD (DUF360 family)